MTDEMVDEVINDCGSEMPNTSKSTKIPIDEGDTVVVNAIAEVEREDNDDAEIRFRRQEMEDMIDLSVPVWTKT